MSQVHPMLQRKEKIEIEEIDGQATFRQIVEKKMNAGWGKFIEYISSFLSLLSSIMYILSTYEFADLSWFYFVDLGFVIFFILEYGLK